MAYVSWENFESYSAGDLNSQGGWSGSADFDVQTGTIYQGTKAISKTTTTGASIIKAVSCNSSGMLSIRMRVPVKNARAGIHIYNAGNRAYDILSYNSGWSLLRTGSVYTVIGADTANSWELLEYEWNGTQARARLNGGSWTSWFSPFAGSVSTPDAVHLMSYGGAGTIYFDDINIDGLATSAPKRNSLLTFAGL